MQTDNNFGVAYTYNEPFTFYEFMFETSQLVKENGLMNVVVSNGYINPDPLKKLLPFIDAFNIDLKAFTKEFYIKQTRGKLEPVLKTLEIIASSQAQLEITNLVIPGLNDNETNFEKMVKWIAENLGNEVPLHLSRYFPQYELNLSATSTKKLEELYKLAKQYLHHVYLGNVNDEKRSSTFCPECGNLLISRNHYKTLVCGLTNDKTCKNCGTQLKIVV
jgi:pyruvate formate lyase activating enzyme